MSDEAVKEYDLVLMAGLGLCACSGAYARLHVLLAWAEYLVDREVQLFFETWTSLIAFSIISTSLSFSLCYEDLRPGYLCSLGNTALSEYLCGSVRIPLSSTVIPSHSIIHKKLAVPHSAQIALCTVMGLVGSRLH